jgi:hypothetical protein
MVYFANDSGNRPIWPKSNRTVLRHLSTPKVADEHVGLSEDQRVIVDYHQFSQVHSQVREKLAALAK